MKVLDAGCGEGRNLMYFLNEEYFVCGVDRDPAAIRVVQFVAGSIRPDLEKENFKVADIIKLPYPQNSFDLIVASAVLHFATNGDHFLTMVSELLRCLKSGGILFVKMASNIGVEDHITPNQQGVYQLPDGSARFLLTRRWLDHLISKHSLEYLKPWQIELKEGVYSVANLILTIR